MLRLRISALVCAIALLFGLLGWAVWRPADQALAATNGTVNFQARLQTAAGNLVPDGFYNVEFKLYSAASSAGSSQGSCAGDSSCLWVETRTGGNQVRVYNGYLTVNLGSVNAFGSINWDQELWLTMNVGGTGSPTWDGEMTPRLKLTAVPYAFRAGQLALQSGVNTSTLGWASQTASNNILLPNEAGTICLQSSSNCGFVAGTAIDFIQNQIASQQPTSNFWISEVGRADTAFRAPLFDTATAAALSIGTANASSITIGSTNTTNTIQSGSGGTTVRSMSNSTTALSVQNASATSLFRISTGTTPGTYVRGTGANGEGGRLYLGDATGFDLYIGDSGSGTGRYMELAANGFNFHTQQGIFQTTDYNGSTTWQVLTSGTGNEYFAFQGSDSWNIFAIDTNTKAAYLGGGWGSGASGTLVFLGSDTGNEITLQAADTFDDYALTLPTGLGSAGDCLKQQDGSGQLVFTSCGAESGSLQGAYNASVGGGTPEIKIDATRGALDIQDADIPTGGSLLAVRTSDDSTLGNTILSVNSGGVVLGQGSALGGALVFANATNGNTITLEASAPGTDQFITLPNASGTVCLTSGNCAGIGGNGDILQGGNTFGTAVTIGTNDNFGLNFEVNNATVASFSNSGTALFRNATNGNFGFEIRASANQQLFRVDTTARKVAIGSYSATAADNITGQLQVIPTSTGRVGINITSPGGYVANYLEATDSTGNFIFRLQSSGNIMTSTGSFTSNTQSAASTNSNAATFGSGTVSGATSTSGQVNILSGNSTTSGNTGAILIRSGVATNGNSGNVTLDVGTASGTTGTLFLADQNASAVVIGNNPRNSSITLQSGSNAIIIGGGSQTGAIQIGTGTGAQTINLGTGGTGAKTVTVGSAAGSSSTTIQGGNGGILLDSAGALDLGSTTNLSISSDAGMFLFGTSFLDINAIGDINIGGNSDLSISTSDAISVEGNSISLRTDVSDVLIRGFDSNSANAFRVQNIAGNNVLSVDTTSSGRAVLGSAGAVNGALAFHNTTNSNTITVQAVAPSTDQFITLPNASGTVCLTSGNCAGVGGTGDVLQGGNTLGTAVTIGTNDNHNLNLETNNQTRLTVDTSGNVGIGGTSSGSRLYVTSALGNTIVEDDFDPTIDNGQWSLLLGASADTTCGAAGRVSLNALRFNGAGTRSATTNNLDTSLGGVVTFYLYTSNQGTGGCESTENNEDIVLEYNNGGAGWITFATYDEANFHTITQVTELIPAAAQTSSTMFRWRQVAHSGNNFDNWTLDNVAISAYESSGGSAIIYGYNNNTVAAVDLLRLSSNVGGTANIKFRVDASGNVFADGTYYGAGGVTTGSADLAEVYRNHDGAQPGDVVVFTDSRTVEKASSAYQTGLAGVVSTKPGFTLNVNEAGVPVALSGRVPVKVGTDNGVIQKGDYLTSGPDGKAQKATAAGPTIGTALEDATEDGTIEVFVHLGYYDPVDDALFNTNVLLALQSSDVTVGNLNVSGEIITDTLRVSGNAYIGGELEVGVAKVTSTLTVGGRIISKGKTVTPQALPALGYSEQELSAVPDPPVVADGTDTAGTITFTTGNNPANGELLRIAFSAPYEASPRIVLEPSNAEGAQLQTYVTKTNDGFIVNVIAPPEAGKTYSFDYVIIGSEAVSSGL